MSLDELVGSFRNVEDDMPVEDPSSKIDISNIENGKEKNNTALQYDLVSKYFSRIRVNNNRVSCPTRPPKRYP